MTVDPTADAAKLLPLILALVNTVDRASFADGAGAPQERRDRLHAAKDTAMESLLDAMGRLATRPQPAPPAGEPEFARWLDQKITEWSAAGGFHDFAVAAKVIRDRLGLAARPKVEDAEVAELSTKLRRALGWSKTRDGLCQQAADLLERLAGYLSDMTADFKDQAAKLAEREAELAKAYDVIAYTLTPADCFCGDIEVVTAAHESHAARQQQQNASAEPTASKAGETR